METWDTIPTYNCPQCGKFISSEVGYTGSSEPYPADDEVDPSTLTAFCDERCHDRYHAAIARATGGEG